MQTAQNYSGGGFSDWYLPNRGELQLMYQNLYRNGLGGFAAVMYWSSSEYSTTNAWFMDFSDGRQATGLYGEESKQRHSFRVRAVRAFTN